ncbi:signal peptide peptidase SppA [Candidatus Uabimicrobium amorphum]|uniref:Serine protease n=1 Tax=Uabimicrobium amorphum TaxID=2596890 RepID=A0A5S9ITI2_UABAM|nr:signal peptide peptidase SppA [Candidatus Uabimicrobium amorphum]BBM87863.1 serine protease [Candidatus Uabimicrobium amorphum]
MIKKIFSGFFFSVLSVVLICVLFVSIMLNIILLGVTAAQQEQSTKSDSFNEKVVEGESDKSKILIVPLQGVISDSGPDTYTVNSRHVKKVFEQAEKDNRIRGVILYINSPGGTITATDKIFHIITKYKNVKKVPVIAYFDGVAASGGYYIAMACDKVICHATTITGSIGVIMSFYQAQELLKDKLGIESIVIKSGEHKDIGSFSRNITEEEREIFNGILMEMYATFLEKVRSGRKELTDMPEDELKKIADGRIYTGKQALELKLVDELGYFDDAKDSICETLGIKRSDTSFVQYEKNVNPFFELLQAQTKAENPVQSMLRQKFTANFYYLWRP